MNLTRERIRQVEVAGLDKLQQEDFAVEARAIDAGADVRREER